MKRKGTTSEDLSRKIWDDLRKDRDGRPLADTYLSPIQMLMLELTLRKEDPAGPTKMN